MASGGSSFAFWYYFLIADRDNEEQIKFMYHLTQLFRQRGKRADLLYVSKDIEAGKQVKAKRKNRVWLSMLQ